MKACTTEMTDRDDISLLGRILPCAYSIADAAHQMGVSETTIRRRLSGLTGWIALYTEGSERPACCIHRDYTRRNGERAIHLGALRPGEYFRFPDDPYYMHVRMERISRHCRVIPSRLLGTDWLFENDKQEKVIRVDEEEARRFCMRKQIGPRLGSGSRHG